LEENVLRACFLFEEKEGLLSLIKEERKLRTLTAWRHNHLRLLHRSCANLQKCDQEQDPSDEVQEESDDDYRQNGADEQESARCSEEMNPRPVSQYIE
jgi:hypothetical protein